MFYANINTKCFFGISDIHLFYFILFYFIKFLTIFIFFLQNTFRYSRLYAKIGCSRSYTFGLGDKEDFEKSLKG